MLLFDKGNAILFKNSIKSVNVAFQIAINANITTQRECSESLR